MLALIGKMFGRGKSLGEAVKAPNKKETLKEISNAFFSDNHERVESFTNVCVNEAQRESFIVRWKILERATGLHLAIHTFLRERGFKFLKIGKNANHIDKDTMYAKYGRGKEIIWVKITPDKELDGCRSFGLIIRSTEPECCK